MKDKKTNGKDSKLTPLEHLDVLHKIAKINTDLYAEKVMIDISNEFIKKALKALEIIKEKEVVVSLLIWSDTLDQYNNNTMLVFSKLTQEEYELLKEVLND